MNRRVIGVIISIITVCFIVIIVKAVVQKSARTIQNDIIEMQGKPIKLDFSNADVYLNGTIAMYNHKEANKLVVFIDSLSCTSCFLNNMAVYYDINDSISMKNGHLVIVLNPLKKSIDEVREKIVMGKYPFYCIIDKNGDFMRKNPHIPDNNMFHSFLLDKSDKIILVGDPTYNQKIKDLFLRQLKLE